MPSLVVIGKQIQEKQRGRHNVPPPLAYMVPKETSLNRVNPILGVVLAHPVLDGGQKSPLG